MRIAICAAIGAALIAVPLSAGAMPMPAGRCSALADGTDQPPPSVSQRRPEAVKLELPKQAPSAYGGLDAALVVDVTFTVGADGTVHSPRVLCSNPDDSYSKALLQAATQWQFKPVIDHGRLWAVQTAYRVRTEARAPNLSASGRVRPDRGGRQRVERAVRAPSNS